MSLNVLGKLSRELGALYDNLRAGTLFVYRKDLNNIGDLYCTPERYFRFRGRAAEIDVCARFLDFKERDVIVGGGGIFYFASVMNKWRIETARKSICWGIGENRHFEMNRETDVNILNRFDLVGLRDFAKAGCTWVPCVSVLHRAFDETYEVTNDVVIYEHRDFPIEISGVPTKKNIGNQTLEDVLTFLGSAETVITNSYHGVYWATLLNRKVLCIPFSTKFERFKHPPTVTTIESWRKDIKKACSYGHALEECRAANMEFSQNVGIALGYELLPTEIHTRIYGSNQILR